MNTKTKFTSPHQPICFLKYSLFIHPPVSKSESYLIIPSSYFLNPLYLILPSLLNSTSKTAPHTQCFSTVGRANRFGLLQHLLTTFQVLFPCQSIFHSYQAIFLQCKSTLMSLFCLNLFKSRPLFPRARIATSNAYRG